jgi:hypothetical protein
MLSRLRVLAHGLDRVVDRSLGCGRLAILPTRVQRNGANTWMWGSVLRVRHESAGSGREDECMSHDH